MAEPLHERLRAQHLTSAPLATAAEVVASLCAVQGQDHELAKWSLGMRMRGTTDAGVESAFARGDFLRTHVLRPTWHFVSPSDIRWLLALTGPRVLRQSAGQQKALELNTEVFRRAQHAITRELTGGRQLTRLALGEVLGSVGIRASGQRLAYIMMQAELTGLVCSGAMQGRQHTYALLDERVPATRPKDRTASLVEIARRFFLGHSPATLAHLCWWSGLTVRAAQEGLESARHGLDREVRRDGTEWWHAPVLPRVRRAAPRGFLVPDYDEVLTGYRDLGVPDHAPSSRAFARPVILDGARIGTWRRTTTASSVSIELEVQSLKSEPHAHNAIEEAAHALGRFLDRDVVLNWLRAGHSRPARVQHT